MKHFIKTSMLTLSISILLSACGGGGSDNHSTMSNNNSDNQSNTTTVNTSSTNSKITLVQGRFIDSAVGNVAVYQKGKKISTTDSEGYFNYQDKGGDLTFKIGNLTLGRSIAKAIVTPADLASDGANVIKILQVLQSLDENSKPDDGIFITQARIDQLITAGDLSKSDTTIEKTVKHDIRDLEIVSEQQALAHFAKSRDIVANSKELNKIAKDVQGYWLYPCDRGNKSFIIKIDKQSATTLVVSRLSEKVYEKENCQGKSEVHVKNRKNVVIILGTSKNSDNQTVIHSLYEDKENAGWLLNSDVFTKNSFRNYVRIEKPTF